jgi:hypothetical protein
MDYKYLMYHTCKEFTIYILNKNTFLISEYLSYQNSEQTLLFLRINAHSLIYYNHLLIGH